ncbi:MAG TPA: WGR domain-containing protein [Microvirga sp.]|nr:WGR domain-containing protein [Microvirga sp.]
MRRFYSLDLERDLFGRVVLVRRWGRIGTAVRVRLESIRGRGLHSLLWSPWSVRRSVAAIRAAAGERLSDGAVV